MLASEHEFSCLNKRAWGTQLRDQSDGPWGSISSYQNAQSSQRLAAGRFQNRRAFRRTGQPDGGMGLHRAVSPCASCHLG